MVKPISRIPISVPACSGFIGPSVIGGYCEPASLDQRSAPLDLYALQKHQQPNFEAGTEGGSLSQEAAQATQ